MSIQWTLIAGFLYFEIGVLVIMLLPIFSPRRWHQFFRSRLCSMFQQYAAVYFYVLLCVLGLFLIDALREMKKYSQSTDATHNLMSEMKGTVKLFRAQRNFYITGFSIFLAFVIRRVVNMLIIQDELSMKAEKIIKEAEATVKLAKSTVLASTIHENDTKNIIESQKQTQALLEEEQKRVKDLEEDVEIWKKKYELAVAVLDGKGDE